MKFRNKCWVLYVGQDKIEYKYKLGQEWQESSPAKRDVRCWSAADQCESAVSPGSLAGKQHPKMHQTLQCQCKRGDYHRIQHWCSLFYNAECSSGPCDLKNRIREEGCLGDVIKDCGLL